jgi:hypothetical protein
MEPRRVQALWNRAPLWRYSFLAAVGLSVVTLVVPFIHPPIDPISTIGNTANLSAPRQERVADAVHPALPKNTPVPNIERSIGNSPGESELGQVPSETKSPISRTTATTKVGDPSPLSLNSPISANKMRPQSTSEAASNSHNPTNSIPIGPEGDILAWLQDTSQEVKDSCKSAKTREPSRSVKPGTTQVHLQPQGLWCFFDVGGTLYDVRMDTSFSGSVSGIRIGDSLAQVKQRLGPPMRQIPMPGMPDTLFYPLGSSLVFRIQPNRAETVETMFVVVRQ